MASIYTNLGIGYGVYINSDNSGGGKGTGNRSVGTCTLELLSDFVNSKTQTGVVDNSSFTTGTYNNNTTNTTNFYIGSLGFSYFADGLTRMGGSPIGKSGLLAKVTSDKTKFAGTTGYPVVIGNEPSNKTFDSSTFYNYYSSSFNGATNTFANGLLSAGSDVGNSMMKMSASGTSCYLFLDLDATYASSLIYTKSGSFNFCTGGTAKITVNSVNSTIVASKSSSSISGFGKVYNYVWQDYADYIHVDDDSFVAVAGKCYVFDNGKYRQSAGKHEKCIIGIHSDLYSYLAGCDGKDSEEGKGHGIAVSVAGFMLAYVDTVYREGTPLTCGKDGVLTRMGLLSRLFHPERLVATFWKGEKSETFHDKVVDGRCWVVVK